MSKLLVDLDDQLLARAKELSGLPTDQAVADAALESYVRRLTTARYESFVDSGALDDLGKDQVIEDAQR